MFEMTLKENSLSTSASFLAVRVIDNDALKVAVSSRIYSLALFKNSLHRSTFTSLHTCVEFVVEDVTPKQLISSRGWFRNWVALNLSLTKM